MSGLETSEDIVIIYIFSIVVSSLPSVVKNPIYQYFFWGGRGWSIITSNKFSSTELWYTYFFLNLRMYGQCPYDKIMTNCFSYSHPRTEKKENYCTIFCTLHTRTYI